MGADAGLQEFSDQPEPVAILSSAPESASTVLDLRDGGLDVPGMRWRERRGNALLRSLRDTDVGRTDPRWTPRKRLESFVAGAVADRLVEAGGESPRSGG